MVGFQAILIRDTHTIIEALNTIDEGACKTAFVVDEKNKLLGALTDGDIRRALIAGAGLKDTIKHIYIKNPICIQKNFKVTEAKYIMEQNLLQAVPVIDKNGIVTDIVRFIDLITSSIQDIPIIIMAGGFGKRLGNLVSNIPKPMLRIAGEPILLHIINNVKKSGFTKIYISVNYKSEIIKNFFGSGEDFGCSINYIEESKPLGTGGSIRLCKGIANGPFIVINGDVLTNMDIKSMLDFHINNKYDMTLATVKNTVNIDYGVLEIENNIVKEIKEKPVIHYKINGGIYCLSPQLMDLIPENEYFEITSLINENITVGSYEINDYWIDIGRISQYEAAQSEFKDVF